MFPGDEHTAGDEQFRIANRKAFLAAAQQAVQPPGVFFWGLFDLQAEFPRSAVVPFQDVGHAFVARQADAAGAAHGRQEELAEVVRDAIAVCGGERLVRIAGGPVGCSADQVSQNPAVFVVVDFLEAARLQLEGLQLSPLAVRPCCRCEVWMMMVSASSLAVTSIS